MEMDDDESGDGRERSLSSILKEKGKTKGTKAPTGKTKTTVASDVAAAMARSKSNPSIVLVDKPGQRHRAPPPRPLLAPATARATARAPQPVFLHQRAASPRPKPKLHPICQWNKRMMRWRMLRR
ncbi:hypothetical protein BRADI_4g28706v3 [Brachypodium distachyon]|uniref:Uncharacterized protein n=1 Tax=Brachypodium distachyon TaxID=15368 RepID=A0A0Q3EUK9_BRADI|nr:hypothetical protein BRADI_4g28706v3 [Brachypodium distachyon]